MRYFFLLSMILYIISCTQPAKTKEVTAKDTSALQVELHRLPELKTVDSIDMHFFDDIKDQKLYTRQGIKDSIAVQLFTIREINNAFVDKVNCEYDTKFFCFSKGQIVKTLYIASLKEGCHFIGYIKSGGIVVKAQLSDSAAFVVNNWRERTKK